jgi:hypothetical protein
LVVWQSGFSREAAAGKILLRRNHALVDTGPRQCQGWDVWIDERFVGALGSRTLQDLASMKRKELLAALLPACCGRHRSFQAARPRATRGGVRAGAGRKPIGTERRVPLSTFVAPQTLTRLDELRGSRSRGQYLDALLAKRHAKG